MKLLCINTIQVKARKWIAQAGQIYTVSCIGKTRNGHVYVTLIEDTWRRKRNGPYRNHATGDMCEAPPDGRAPYLGSNFVVIDDQHECHADHEQLGITA